MSENIILIAAVVAAIPAILTIGNIIYKFLKSNKEPKPKPFNKLPKNSNFVGREHELEEIKRILNKKKRVVVVANGGYGKSQLAIKYAHLAFAKKAYRWVYQIDADGKLMEDYKSFAKKLGLSLPEEISDEDALFEIDTWLGENKGYLLIFENAETLPNLHKFLPTTPHGGHIIVNTRNTRQNIPESDQIPLELFNEKESIQFLKTRLSAMTHKITDSEAETLVNEMGRLPLAMEQAAAFMLAKNEHTKDYVQKYIEMFRNPKHKHRLLHAEEKAEDYDNRTVYTTWLISYEQLEPASKQLFNICAYYAPDNIPLQMLMKGHELLPKPLQNILNHNNEPSPEGYELITGLEKYSLVTSNKSGEIKTATLSIHRIVQDVMRVYHERNEEDDNAEWLSAALSVACRVFDIKQWHKEDMDKFKQNLPHSLEVARHAEKIFLNDINKQEAIGHLYSAVGEGLTMLRDYSDALKWHQKALAIKLKVLGEEHPSTATTYSNIAYVYDKQGEDEKALAWCQKALVINEKVPEQEHSDTATTYNNISVVYDNQRKYAKALEGYKKASAIREKVSGQEPDTASIYNNIADVYDKQNKYDEALAWHQKALAIYKKNPEQNRHDIDITCSTMESIRRRQCENYKVLKKLIDGYIIHLKLEGEAHPNTQYAYKKLKMNYVIFGSSQPFQEWLSQMLTQP